MIVKLNQIQFVLTDKGSKYAVTGAQVQTKADVERVLRQIKSDKKFNKATHHSWAAVLSTGNNLKNDDGESGAGMVILRVLLEKQVRDHVVIVTRWYGGTKLGGDRFRHVKTCTQRYLDDFMES